MQRIIMGQKLGNLHHQALCRKYQRLSSPNQIGANIAKRPQKRLSHSLIITTHLASSHAGIHEVRLAVSHAGIYEVCFAVSYAGIYEVRFAVSHAMVSPSVFHDLTATGRR